MRLQSLVQKSQIYSVFFVNRTPIFSLFFYFFTFKFKWNNIYRFLKDLIINLFLNLIKIILNELLLTVTICEYQDQLFNRFTRCHNLVRYPFDFHGFLSFIKAFTLKFVNVTVNL